VVHTIRDSPEKWLQSARETIFPATINAFTGYHELVDLGWPPGMILGPVRGFGEMLRPWLDVLFGTRVVDIFKTKGWKAARAQMEQILMKDDALALSTYNAWTERIKKEVKPENLLVFNVKEGWEPLCKFLNLPVPAEPFPNVNDMAQFKRTINAIMVYVTVSKGIAYGVRAAAWTAFGYGAWLAAKRFL
jgi:hypothetical protein